jgi:hypothetical protein
MGYQGIDFLALLEKHAGVNPACLECEGERVA